MKKFTIYILLLSFSKLFSQTLSVEQVKTDLDSVISILSTVHPTFNESPNKEKLTLLRDTLSNSMTIQDLFKNIQPLVALDGHTTLQYNGEIHPDVANPLLPFGTVIFDNRLYIKNNLSTDTSFKRRPDKFLPFIDSAFTVIKDRHLQNLIIDKTEGGGFGQLVYILTGPRAYSAATMFVAMAKCYSNAIIIGEERGQPLISNGSICRNKLLHSGMNLYSSFSIYYLPCAANDQDGIKPDIEVKMSWEDLLTDSDKYLEHAVELIKNKVNE